MLYGCDISKWQGLDFDISNEDFVIAKATEGKTYTDPCFHHNIEKAINLGKLIGAYHYARPENNTAKEEAQNFVTAVKPYIGNCLLALDWEGTALNYSNEWALEWLQEVERLTGVKPLIYSNEWVLEKMQTIADNGNGIWCAKWSSVAPNLKPVFSVMALWQYTSNPYDKDKFFGTPETWQKYCTSALKTDSEEEGNASCGCAFCKDFEEWVKSHGYVKE